MINYYDSMKIIIIHFLFKFLLCSYLLIELLIIINLNSDKKLHNKCRQIVQALTIVFSDFAVILLSSNKLRLLQRRLTVVKGQKASCEIQSSNCLNKFVDMISTVSLYREFAVVKRLRRQCFAAQELCFTWSNSMSFTCRSRL